ncbi:MAG: 6-phosphogluconolactonase [Hyphomonadaceae bacterium]|nr:6-phosphogluconolactonase [Hyphomonadaceae bacterium]
MTLSTPLVCFQDRAQLHAAAAGKICETLSDALHERNAACAALSGGSTPEPVYALLARMPLDWAKVTFALVDERFVPPTDAASNEAMLRRALAPALEKGARLVPMYADAASPEDAAMRADAAYAPLKIDIAVMGMGIDAHTASWFANSPALASALDPRNPRAVIALEAPGADGAAQRLTLTRAKLARAGEVMLLITGEDKRQRLGRALSQAQNVAPVAALFSADMPPIAALWAP